MISKYIFIQLYIYAISKDTLHRNSSLPNMVAEMKMLQEEFLCDIKIYFYSIIYLCDIKIYFYSIKINLYSIKYIFMISKYIFIQSKQICILKEIFLLYNFFFIQLKYTFIIRIFHSIVF